MNGDDRYILKTAVYMLDIDFSKIIAKRPF